MDASRRFQIQQPTGGETVEFLRLVELQAAASQAGAILARFAGLVHDNESIPEWKRIQSTYAEKTQQLWKEQWFYDFDTRTMELVTTTPPDPSQAAPAFCGIATEEQNERILPKLRQMWEQACVEKNGNVGDSSGTLIWSSFMLPYLESLWAAGDLQLAAQVVAETADRIYASMDRHSERTPDGTHDRLGWPGVSCEVWGCSGAFGGEVYGWGAVMPAHILRSLVGFRETEKDGEFLLCPNFPQSLNVENKQYGVRGLRYGVEHFHLTYTILDKERLSVEIECPGNLRIQSVHAPQGTGLNLIREGVRWRFEARNHVIYTVQLS